MSEFDYQWENLFSPALEYNEDRIKELLEITGKTKKFFNNKIILDAGCGSGRYTYAMMHLGGHVDSVDKSSIAVKKCKEINSNTKQKDIADIEGQYDFIFCFGVLHHTKEPLNGFNKLVGLLRQGGTMHVMVYGAKTQKRYKKWRKRFKALDQEGRLRLCERLDGERGNIHGWYDALNPEYNHGFTPDQIIKWYGSAGFKNIKVMETPNININGQL